MKPEYPRAAGAAAIAAVTLWAVWPGLRSAPAPGFMPPSAPVASVLAARADERPRLFSGLVSGTHSRSVHAASLVERPDGRLFAVWFGGTREGSADVRIYGAEGVPDAGGATLWGEPKSVASREETGENQARWVRKLGNPVIFAGARHGLGLVYVSVSMGGWANSQLNLLYPFDAEAPAASRRLVTSPFFNKSTLVKGAPVFFDNGDIGLPVYHELVGKFAELLVLTPAGEVRRKIRMDHGRRTLQPVLLVEDAQHAVALMRDGDVSLRVWRSETANAGRDWSEPAPTDLPNPNSALTAVNLDDGRLLAVANDTEDERLRLSLLVSEDRGKHWRAIHRFEDRQSQIHVAWPEAAFRAQLSADLATLGPARMAAAAIVDAVVGNMCQSRDACYWRYDYPYLIRASDGDFHLVYTWNSSFIRYIRFNAAWLRERLGEAA